jgi:RNA polymerase sigma-70 factor (ECF subfamily)
MDPSDEILIEKAKSGDKQAFTELFDKYSHKILGYLYRYVGDYQLAEDLTIETFLNVYSSLGTYKEIGKFSSWLYKIATNCAKKELRKKERKKEISLDEPVETDEGATNIGELIADERDRPDYNVRETELKELIYRIISKLDKKYKEVLMLCDVEGLSHEEASKILKSNPITIGTRLRRARQALYSLLQKAGYRF